MVIRTKIFGEIDVNTEKLISFPDGIIGFPDLKQFMLIYDEDKKDSNISWLQSIDEPAFALPVINPLKVEDDYNPMVEDELLSKLGNLKPENMLVLVTITVPSDITKMTVNLKAPIVINAEENKAAQIIVDDEAYEIKHPIYDKLKKKRSDV